MPVRPYAIGAAVFAACPAGGARGGGGNNPRGLHQEVGDEPAPVAPEQQLFELAPTRLIGSLVLSGTTFVLVPALIAIFGVRRASHAD